MAPEEGGRTIDFLGRGVNDLVVVEPLCPRAIADTAEAADDIFCDSSVFGELSAELLHHAVYVIELGLVAGGCGHGHATTHVGAIHAIHPAVHPATDLECD